MKKLKALYTSVLSLVMCGAIGLSACGDPSSSSNSSGGSSGSSSSSSSGVPTPTKAEVYANIGASIEEMATSGSVFELGLTLDMTQYYAENTEASLPAYTEKINLAVAAHMQHVAATTEEEVDTFTLDAFLNSYYTDTLESEQAEPPYQYLEAFLRPDNAGTLFFGSAIGETKPTQVESYSYLYLEDLVGALTEYLPTGEPTPTNEGAGGDIGDVGGDVATGPSEEDMAAMEAAMAKLFNCFLAAVDGTVAVDEGTTTLTIDVKQELSALLDLVVDVTENFTTAQPAATVGEVLDLPATKVLFNAYFGDMTAEDCRALINGFLAGGAPAVEEEQGAYDYLTAWLKSMPAGADESAGTVANMPINDYTENIVMGVGIAQSMLAEMQEWEIHFSLTNDTFSGFGFDFAIADEVNLSFAISVQAVTDYKFKTIEADDNTMTHYTYEDLSGIFQEIFAGAGGEDNAQ